VKLLSHNITVLMYPDMTITW